VSDIVATPGHEKVELTWIEAAKANAVSVEIFRGFWGNGSGSSAYPLYGQLAGNVIPIRPTSYQEAVDSPEWVLVDIVMPGDQAFTDLISPRGVYYYEIFLKDAFGNTSDPATESDRATNYWLGDVASGGDGAVSIADLNSLGDSYGVSAGHPYFNPEVDVGPSDTGLGTGIPVPSGNVGFEDLIIFGLNYGEVSPDKIESSPTALPVIVWYPVTETLWSCRLVEPCDDLKGLHLVGHVPDGNSVTVESGDLIDQQTSPIFLRNAMPDDLDIGFAVMGNGQGLVGTGELFRVRLSQPVDLSGVFIEARGLANEDLEVELHDQLTGIIPRTFELSQNYPNPFNPSTKISFSLPSDETVRLAVYSLDGRLVRVLLSGPRIAGRHEVVWDGADDQGRSVASGAYFCRLAAGQFSHTTKMILMK